MIDSTVDLPQPEWPRMATNSPASICALTSLTAMNGPVGVAKTLVRPVSSSGTFIGVSSATAAIAGDGASSPAARAGRRARRPSAAVSVATTCARTCVRLLVVRELRRRCAAAAARTGIGAPSVAGGPASSARCDRTAGSPPRRCW